MAGKRVYSEEEVARLIRRAVELDAERSPTGREGAESGLTISEIEQVASEAGIDPELIQKAADELEYGTQKSGLHRASDSSSNTPSGRKKAEAEIRSNEIFCERWVDAQPDTDTMNSLVTELNHRYGTSDDISWWNKLWDSYEGKAKIRKTPGSLDWLYTDNWEYYSTRVLLQKRGNRFRIRVSKRLSWGLNWKSEGLLFWMMAPVFLVIGGVLGFSLFDSAITGIAAGGGMMLMMYPFVKTYNTRYLNRQQDEVASLADDLADFTMELIDEKKHQNLDKTGKEKPTDKPAINIDIEIDPEEEFHHNADRGKSTGTSGSLRNRLK